MALVSRIDRGPCILPCVNNSMEFLPAPRVLCAVGLLWAGLMAMVRVRSGPTAQEGRRREPPLPVAKAPPLALKSSHWGCLSACLSDFGPNCHREDSAQLECARALLCHPIRSACLLLRMRQFSIAIVFIVVLLVAQTFALPNFQRRRRPATSVVHWTAPQPDTNLPLGGYRKLPTVFKAEVFHGIPQWYSRCFALL